MDYQVVGVVLGALFFIAGGLATLYRFLNTLRKEREEENQKTLQTAKEYTDNLFKSLESELEHQKDIHDGKVVELSQKIEELREEMRRHHSQLLSLLQKMVEKDR